jgi:ectoine hydroxylase-related dioxygenase (phytanoyl-CoA dioxygenase family)
MVHNFEPFYFNVLLPLVRLTKENGSTEFILGSHKSTYNESIDKKKSTIYY